ncbi:hypothetical protein SUGI_1011710 [Cryptomeria japonica]|nr:hypothetical protein SUGI_1011710 [Cryptomeria japonica]
MDLHRQSGAFAVVPMMIIFGSQPTETVANFFGSVWVVDAPMMEGPEPTSRLLGRAQGLYTISSQGNDLERLSQGIVLNFVFQSGEFNGSTLGVVATQISPYFN